MKIGKRTGTVAAVVALVMIGELPFGSAQEEKGIGKSLEQMVAEAKTPADHQAVAAVYQKRSAGLQKDAAQHAELAKWWASLAGGQALANPRYEQAEHCRKFADLLEKAAQEAQSLAKGHEKIAQAVAGSGK
jgi:hypothetical protein